MPYPGGLIGGGSGGGSGADGASAYEIAVANGFVGNEEAWLASLQGDGGSGIESWDATQAAANYWNATTKPYSVGSDGSIYMLNTDAQIDSATAGGITTVDQTADPAVSQGTIANHWINISHPRADTFAQLENLDTDLPRYQGSVHIIETGKNAVYGPYAAAPVFKDLTATASTWIAQGKFAIAGSGVDATIRADPELTVNTMIALVPSGKTITGFADLNYAIHMTAPTAYTLYQLGGVVGGGAIPADGTVSVSRDGSTGVVTYRVNGSVVATSGTTTTAALDAVALLYQTGNTVNRCDYATDGGFSPCDWTTVSDATVTEVPGDTIDAWAYMAT